VAAALLRAQSCIAAMDAEGIEAPAPRQDDVVGALAKLPARVDVSRLFQVDMVKPVEHATLGPDVLREIERGIAALHRMTPTYPSPLRRFCEEFTARFGDAEVPLVLALDEEVGIGFESSQTPHAEAPPLLAGLPFPPTASSPAVSWDRATSWLLQRLCTTLARRERTLVLTERDLEQMSVESPTPLPDAFSTTVQIAARSEAALASGEFKVLVWAGGGPPGARLAGRFCHVSPEIHRGVSAHLRAEEALRPEAIFAEIVHLPAGRVGNVLCRPVLRGYEIPFLGISGAPPDRRIPVGDLLVSVRDERVVLHSRRLGREVVPRLSSAHVWSGRGLGIYRFLGALQGQDGQGFHWTWGPLEAAPFLPRVELGRVVLQRARWRLGPDDLGPLKAVSAGKAAKTPAEIGAARHAAFQVVQRLRAALELPRWVVLADGDNELTIDLDNALAVDSFVHLVKQRHVAVLSECFPGGDELVVEGPEGGYQHQINVSATRRAPPRPAPRRTGRAPRRGPALVSRWL
jgi:hypothetical protein